MLDAWTNHLRQLCGAGDPQLRREIVEEVRKANKLAVIWCRVLSCGTEFPETFGLEIASLGWAIPIMTRIDTSTELGKFLEKVFSLLPQSDRERLERAILSLADLQEDRYNLKACKRQRDRLLGCLPPDALVTSEARALRSQLDATNGAPPNELPFSSSDVTVSPYTEADFLQEQGVPVENQANLRIQELERPLKSFVAEHQNTSPSLEQIAAITPAIRALHGALETAHADGVHPKQSTYAWGQLAAASETIAKSRKPDCGAGDFALIKRLLLEASTRSDPEPNPEYDNRFDGSWGSSTRVSGARGLILLSRSDSCATPEVLEAIERLSNDPVPAVRYQVAWHLSALYETAPELMWRILEGKCHGEAQNGVIQGVTRPLRVLAGHDTKRVAVLTKTILDRVVEGPGTKKVGQSCLQILTGLYVWRNVELCEDALFPMVDAPPGKSPCAQRAAFHSGGPYSGTR